MREHKKPSGFGRGMAILAIVALGAMAVTPAFSAFKATKGKVKKISRKQATKQIKQKIDDFGNPIFIEEDELVRFGPVTAQVGDAAKPIGTWGPFSLQLLCTDDVGSTRLQVQISTTENNSLFDSDLDDDADFDAADSPQDRELVDFTSPNPTGGAAYVEDEDDEFHAAAPSGVAIDGKTNAFTEFAGSHCYTHGWVIQTVPA